MTLQPIAEIFAVAVVAQQLQMALGKYRTMEAMSELTLSIAAEINSALQTIIGHCDLLERGYPDPSLQRDLATIVRQAQRIEALLAKMRDRRERAAARRSEAAVYAGRHPVEPRGLRGRVETVRSSLPQSSAQRQHHRDSPAARTPRPSCATKNQSRMRM